MILRFHHLTRHPGVFRAMIGLSVGEFDALARDRLPCYSTNAVLDYLVGVRGMTARSVIAPAERLALTGRGHRLQPRLRTAVDEAEHIIGWLRRFEALT